MKKINQEQYLKNQIKSTEQKIEVDELKSQWVINWEVDRLNGEFSKERKADQK